MLQKHVTQEVDGVREGQNNHVLTTTLLERKINELESEVRRALFTLLSRPLSLSVLISPLSVPSRRCTEPCL